MTGNLLNLRTQDDGTLRVRTLALGFGVLGLRFTEASLGFGRSAGNALPCSNPPPCPAHGVR